MARGRLLGAAGAGGWRVPYPYPLGAACSRMGECGRRVRLSSVAAVAKDVSWTLGPGCAGRGTGGVMAGG